MNVPKQFPQPPLSYDGKSYMQTTVGIVKVVSIILGMITVGVGYTQLKLEIAYKIIPPESTTTTTTTTTTPSGPTTEYINEFGYNDYGNKVRSIQEIEYYYDPPEPEPCSHLEIERFYLAVTIIALILSVYSLRRNSLAKVKSTCPDVIFHIVAGILLISAGLLFIGFGAYNSSADSGCECEKPMKKCKNTYQIVAGLFALFNGILYLVLGFYFINKISFGKTKKEPAENSTDPKPTPSQVQNMPNGSATPSQQNVGPIPLQGSQQNMQQLQPGSNPVQ